MKNSKKDRIKSDLYRSETIPKLYFQMAMPVVLGLVVSMVYYLVDAYFLASLGSSDLIAGVALVSPIFTVLMAIGNIFGQGGSSLLARLFGQKNQEDMRRVSSWCFYMSLIVGAVVLIVLLALNRPVLSLLGANEKTMPFARAYYLGLVGGAPVMILSYIHSNFLRAEGRAKEAMIGTIGGSVVNMLLDPLLISGAKLGAAGAAIATILGFLFTDLFDLYIVFSRSETLSVKNRSLRLEKTYRKEIFSIGLVSALTYAMSSVGEWALNRAFLSYGDERVAAFGIAARVALIVQLVITGLSYGGLPLYGFYYGAKEKERLKKTIRFAVVCILGFGVIGSLAVTLLAHPLCQLFLKEQPVLGYAVQILRYLMLSVALAGMVQMITILFQATGKARPALVLSLSRQGIVFLPVLLILSYSLHYQGVLIAQVVTDFVTVLIAGALFVKKLYPEIRG